MAKKPVILGKLQSFLIRLLAFLMAGEGLTEIVHWGLPLCFQKMPWSAFTALQLGLGLLKLLSGFFVLKGWSWGLPLLAAAWGYRLYLVGFAFWGARGEIIDLTGSLISIGVIAFLLGATLLCFMSWHLGRVFWQRSGRLWRWAFYLLLALLALGTSVQFDEQGPHPAPELSAAEARAILNPLSKPGAQLAFLRSGHSASGTLHWKQSSTQHGTLVADKQGFRIKTLSGYPDFDFNFNACSGLLSVNGRDFYPRGFASDSLLYTKGPSQGVLFERGTGAAHGQVILARELKSKRWYLVLSEFFWYGMEFKALGYRIEWPERAGRKKAKKLAEESWTGCDKALFKTRNKK